MRRSSAERQVTKVHELKGFFDTKFVYFIQICENFVSKFFETEYRRSGITLSYLFWGQISNNSNYRKKFEYLVKFILMKIRINLYTIEIYAQPIQNL